MELKVKNIRLTTGVPVIILTQENADNLGISVGGRASIKKSSSTKKPLSVIVDISDSMVKNNEVGLSKETKLRLNAKSRQDMVVNLAEVPSSLQLIKKKLNKQELSDDELDEIIEDVVDNSLSSPEIALFVSAMYSNGMSLKETIYLIEAILKTGNLLKFKNQHVVDKHCIGGIPGNRTTPIVVSICAAAGLIMPKNSSRAITSAAGTADVIESIAKIEFSISELKKIVKKTNACMVWGGSLEIVPADSKIISVEKSLKIDPEAQLLASIMSKKLASDSNYILIDIPYGRNAKVNLKRAKRIKRKFENLGRFFHKKIKVVLTKGDQPIGNGIGPELELQDVISVLKQMPNRPLDLEKKSLYLSGILLEMVGKAKENEGLKMAQQLLISQKAFNKFKQIIEAQKGRVRPIKESKFKKDLFSKRNCKIKDIDNKLINSLARITGCPNYKSAGLYLYKHLGDSVKKEDKIITIYADSKGRLKQAEEFYKKYKPIKFK